MNQYFSTTAKLKALILGRVQVRKDLKDLETSIELIEKSLIPPDGKWPGTNDTDRKAAKELAYTNSQPLVTAKTSKQEKETSLAIMDAEIEVARLDLTAMEWSIRDQSNVALGGRSIFDELDDNTAEATKITVGMLESDLTPEEQAIEELDAAAYPIPGDSAWQPKPDADPTEEAAQAVSRWAKDDRTFGDLADGMPSTDELPF